MRLTEENPDGGDEHELIQRNHVHRHIPWRWLRRRIMPCPYDLCVEPTTPLSCESQLARTLGISEPSKPCHLPSNEKKIVS